MKQHVSKQWHLIDADGQILGRLSTRIAILLMGKHKPEFVRYEDRGDYVIVVNAVKVKVTGKKSEQKIYYHHSGYPGGLKAVPYEKLMAEKPVAILLHAVRGMLPHNRLGDRLIKKLHVYASAEHPHTNVGKELVPEGNG